MAVIVAVYIVGVANVFPTIAVHVWSHDTPAAAETTSDNPEGVYNEIDEKQIYLVPQREVHNGGRQNSEQGANPYASLNP